MHTRSQWMVHGRASMVVGALALAACSDGGLDGAVTDPVAPAEDDPGDDTAAPVTDSAHPDATPSAMEVASFAGERAISEAEAEERLRWQLKVPRLSDLAGDRLGPVFGGVWVDVHDGDRIKLGVVGDVDGLERDPSEPPLPERDGDDATHGDDPRDGLIGPVDAWRLAQTAIDDADLSGVADVVLVQHSLSDLTAANDWLSSQLVDSGASGSLIVGLRTDLNAVELQRPRGRALTDVEEQLVAAALAKLGDVLVVGEYAGRVEPRTCTYPYCSSPLRGGNRIHNNGTCTNAFVARSRVDSKVYQFTAGHCVENRSGNWKTRLWPGSSKKVIGPAHNFIFGTAGDMAILRVDEDWWVSSWVHVTSGPDTTTDTEYEILAERSSFIGMRICTTGASFGRSDCGNVTALGVTASYGGKTVTNLGRGNFCGVPGDSGAPMYASRNAYGLQVAGASQCDSFYQGIIAAENQMNVNIMHVF